MKSAPRPEYERNLYLFENDQPSSRRLVYTGLESHVPHIIASYDPEFIMTYTPDTWGNYLPTRKKRFLQLYSKFFAIMEFSLDDDYDEMIHIWRGVPFLCAECFARDIKCVHEHTPPRTQFRFMMHDDENQMYSDYHVPDLYGEPHRPDPYSEFHRPGPYSEQHRPGPYSEFHRPGPFRIGPYSELHRPNHHIPGPFREHPRGAFTELPSEYEKYMQARMEDPFSEIPKGYPSKYPLTLEQIRMLKNATE